MSRSIAKFALTASIFTSATGCESLPESSRQVCVQVGNFAPLRDVSKHVSKAVDATLQTFGTHFAADNTSLVTGKFRLDASAGDYSVGTLTMVRRGDVVAECHGESSGTVECQGGNIAGGGQPNSLTDTVITNYQRVNITPTLLFHEEYVTDSNASLGTSTAYPYASMQLEPNHCEATFRGQQGLSCENSQEVCVSTFASLQNRVNQLHQQFIERVGQ